MLKFLKVDYVLQFLALSVRSHFEYPVGGRGTGASGVFFFQTLGVVGCDRVLACAKMRRTICPSHFLTYHDVIGVFQVSCQKKWREKCLKLVL